MKKSCGPIDVYSRSSKLLKLKICNVGNLIIPSLPKKLREKKNVLVVPTQQVQNLTLFHDQSWNIADMDPFWEYQQSHFQSSSFPS